METPKHPWSRINHIFNPLIKEEDITTIFETGLKSVRKTNGIIQDIQDVIDQKIDRLGLTGKKLLTLPKEVREGELGSAIKSDSAWQKAYQELLAHLAPNLDAGEVASHSEHILRPDWNSPQFGLVGYEFDKENNHLDLRGKVSHAYLSFLSSVRDENGNQVYPDLKLDSMSVVGILVTKDNYLISGLRAGHNFADTIMNIPAGSVEPHSGQNPLYESIDAEFIEELALSRDEWKTTVNSGLVAMTEDHASEQKRTYAVFRAETIMSKKDLTLNEIIKRWKESAEDKGEHRRLEFYPNNPKYVLEKIKHNGFDYANAQLPLSNTSPENHGTILPQCAINMLAHFAQQSFPEGARNAEEYLEGRYKLIE